MDVFFYQYEDETENYIKNALSKYSGKPETNFVISRALHGKPYVENSDIHFSVSHSHGVIVCAVSQNEIGVDIEKVRPIKNYREISKKLFKNEDLLVDEFFDKWASYEAYLKYTGIGFSNGYPELDKDVFIDMMEAPKGYVCAICTNKPEKVNIISQFRLKS